MPFVVLQTFKVKLFLENSLWSNILNHLQTKLTPLILLFFDFLQYGPEEVIILPNWIYFNFGSAKDQKYVDAACDHIFLHFWAAIMGFLIIVESSVFFILIAIQQEFPPVKYYLCCMCTSNKNKALKTIKSSFSAICRICWGANFEIIFSHK